MFRVERLIKAVSYGDFIHDFFSRLRQGLMEGLQIEIIECYINDTVE